MSLTSVSYFQNSEDSTSQTDMQKHNVTKPETKNDNICQLMWFVATKQLKPSDWKKLALHWKFTQEQITAISHQYTGFT